MWKLWVVAAAVLACGCVETKTVTCGALVCSEASVCSPSGDRCVLPSQVDSCAGRADGDACSYTGVSEGVCNALVCLPAGCGNGVVETAAGEVCDDENRVSFDGCSADCKSSEVCGDGQTDPALGEQCDCGMAGMTVMGCTRENSAAPGSTCRPDCRLARCGDGVVDPHEMCDDGNNVPGDGCRADCDGRWTLMASGTFADLEAIWGTGPDNIFAVGEAGTIVHYDGTKWTHMTTPTPKRSYTDVWGSGTVVYAVGTNNTTGAGFLDRYDGTSWQLVKAYAAGATPRSIHGRSPTDFWVAGDKVLERWNGVAGTPTTCPAGDNFSSVWTAEAGSTARYASLGDGQVCVQSGAGWATSAGITGRYLWGTSGTNLFAMHTSSTLIAHSTNGTAFTPMPIAGEMFGSGASRLGGSPGDVLLVGEGGKVIRFDGTTWTVSPTPTSDFLNHAWGYMPNRAFIVGRYGRILY